jgi:hypothetical protein
MLRLGADQRERFPLITVAGGAAAAATAVGLAAVAATSVVSAREGASASGKIEDWVGNELEKQAKQDAAAEPEPWTDIDELLWEFFGPFGPCLIMAIPGLVLTGAAMAMPQSQPAAGGRRLRRIRWLPRIPRPASSAVSSAAWALSSSSSNSPSCR